MGCEAGDPDGPTASAGAEPGRRPGRASSGRGGRRRVGTARGDSGRAGLRSTGREGHLAVPGAPIGQRCQVEAEPVQMPATRSGAPPGRAARAHHGSGVAGRDGGKGQGSGGTWHRARASPGQHGPLEPPGQWGLREGALGAQEFQGREVGCLADGASARARRRSGRPRPPHPVVARARRPLVRRPPGLGTHWVSGRKKTPCPPARRTPLLTPTSAVRPLDSSAAAQGDSDTATELLETRLFLVFLGLRCSDRGVLTSRAGLAPPPSALRHQ